MDIINLEDAGEEIATISLDDGRISWPEEIDFVWSEYSKRDRRYCNSPLEVLTMLIRLLAVVVYYEAYLHQHPQHTQEPYIERLKRAHVMLRDRAVLTLDNPPFVDDKRHWVSSAWDYLPEELPFPKHVTWKKHIAPLIFERMSPNDNELFVSIFLSLYISTDIYNTINPDLLGLCSSPYKSICQRPFGVDPLKIFHNFNPENGLFTIFDVDGRHILEDKHNLPEGFHSERPLDELDWSDCNWFNHHDNVPQRHIRRSNPGKGIKKLCKLYAIADDAKADRDGLIRIDLSEPTQIDRLRNAIPS